MVEDEVGDEVMLGSDLNLDEDEDEDKEKPWSQRRLFKQERSEYRDTRPKWSDYMDDETNDAVSSFRDSYEGKGPWWKSDEFEVDMEPVREKYMEAMSSWKDNRPSWDNWNSDE